MCGVLGVDLNPSDNAPPGNAFGSCVLLSTDGRPSCGPAPILCDWLPGLADGVDPIAYRTETSVRLVLPVESATGADLLMIDFDNTSEPPIYLSHFSVKAHNAAGIRPTEFPGFETDVDMLLLPAGQCGLAVGSILVPVEGSGDVGDLYRLGLDGGAIWTLSHDSNSAGLTIPGYEAGVDLVQMCGLPAGASARIAVPVENAAGTNADLWLVDLATGEVVLIATARGFWGSPAAAMGESIKLALGRHRE